MARLATLVVTFEIPEFTYPEGENYDDCLQELWEMSNEDRVEYVKSLLANSKSGITHENGVVQIAING